MTWDQIVMTVLGSLAVACIIALLVLVIMMKVSDAKFDKEYERIMSKYYKDVYKVTKEFLSDLLKKHLITAQQFVDLRQLANIAYQDKDDELLIDIVKNPKTYFEVSK